MDYIFKDWKDALDKFQDCVDKDLAEIRKEKAQIRQMKAEIFDRLEKGQYIFDKSRLVLSAPEIIIGNVDKEGVLKTGTGRIVLRGNAIDLEASGEDGRIVSRATTLRQSAVDPGPDGMDAVVHPSSSVCTKGRSIVLDSENAKGCFLSEAGGFPGIQLRSDSGVEVRAAKGSESLLKTIDDNSKALKDRQSKLKSDLSKKKKTMDDLFKQMEDTMKKGEKLGTGILGVRTDVMDMIELGQEVEKLSPAFYAAVKDYTSCVSELAEVSRRIKCLDDKKKDADGKKGDYKKKSTGNAVNISAENIRMNVIDGDGNIRDNETAGVDVRSVNVRVASTKADGSLIDKGKFSVNAQNFLLSTASTTMKDEKGGESPATGDIKILTKTMEIESVDYDIKDGKPEEKDITDKSAITIRTQALDFRATDKDGKAVGRATVNAKAVEIKSMNIDKDSKDDKELAQGSSMVLVAEKMYAGASDDKKQSKQFQLSSEKVGVFAKTTAEFQQDKATVQLDGGNLNVGGSKTALFGETTVNGKTAFKADVTAPKATVDNLEAKTSFKSTNISDGIPVPGAPSTASLSTKLKAEEAPKAK
ncbi:MAG: hypothetical protein J6Y32_06850 [Bacteroidales bacterium]|nr:hypothetical protein [Bacteroidales bacterium]